MTYSDTLFTMWLDVWGNMLLGAVALLAVFFYLCFRKRLGVGDSILVIFPVLFGLITAEYIPTWVKGMFLIPVGLLWGMMILRITGLR